MYKPKNKERNESSNIVQKIQQMAFLVFLSAERQFWNFFKKLTALEDAVGHCSLRNKSFSASKLHWKAKNYIKGFGFFYNLVAIYYTNSKFILNNKTWYIYCIYIYIKKKGKAERNA